jgi:hypothetical protein
MSTGGLAVSIRRSGLVAAALLVAAPLAASTLEVQEANVHTGNSAARVGVASGCLFDLHAVIAGQITPGTYSGCSSLTADGEASGDTRLIGGDQVVLSPGFAFEGNSLTIEIDRALYPDAWVQDDTPDGETVYTASFYVDATTLDLDAADRFFHFIAFDANGEQKSRLGVKFNSGAGERRIFLEVVEDDGGIVSTEATLEELVLPSGWHLIDVGVHFQELGFAYLCVDSPAPPTGCVVLDELDIAAGAIDFVRWGALDVPSDSALGSLDLDDFLSNPPFEDGFEDGFAAWAARSQP